MVTGPNESPGFRLDVRDERLWEGDLSIRLTPKAFVLLRHFVQNPNRLLTKDEILDEVWPDTFVSEGLVREYVQDLRRALNDDPRQPRYIETVHRRGYRFIGNIDTAESDAEEPRSQQQRALPPAIAVLQFMNLAGDERWDRFAAGLCEDLITDLLRYPDLQVIGRNSTLAYGGRPLDVREIGRELNAAYVLDGSIQAGPDKVRVTAQLVHARTGGHLWAERYNRSLGDLFAIQDDIVEQVASALGGFHGEILRAEHARLRRKRPNSLTAYELYVLGYLLENKLDKENTLKSIDILERAIEMDPGFSRSWLILGWAYGHMAYAGWTEDAAEFMGLRRHAMFKAAELDPRDPIALEEIGGILAEEGEIDAAREILERALDLGRNYADALALLAKYVATVLGRVDEAMEMMRKSFRLNPQPPSWYYMNLLRVAYFAGEFDTAAVAAKRASDFLSTHVFELATLGQLGRTEEAKQAVRAFRKRHPAYVPETMVKKFPIIRDEHVQLFWAGLRKSGLIG